MMYALLRQAYEAEMTAAMDHYNMDAFQHSFSRLERAHILAQSFSIEHARTH
jgi:hypothetical protein